MPKRSRGSTRRSRSFRLTSRRTTIAACCCWSSIEPQHRVEAGERFLGTMLDQKQQAAIVAGLDVRGNERECLVEPRERFGIAVHGTKRQPEIRQRVGRSRLDLERGGKEPIGFSDFSGLQLERAEQVQGVEMRGRRFEDPCVDLLRVVESALLVQRQRLLEPLRKRGRNGWQGGFRHRLARSYAFCSSSTSRAEARVGRCDRLALADRSDRCHPFWARVLPAECWSDRADSDSRIGCRSSARPALARPRIPRLGTPNRSPYEITSTHVNPC